MSQPLVLGIGNALTDICVNATDGLLDELQLPKGSMQLIDLMRSRDLLARGKERVHIHIQPVKPLDTTGAGDLYATGFLYGVVKEASLEICGRFGSIIAAEIIQTLGAHMDMPTWDRIRQAYPAK